MCVYTQTSYICILICIMSKRVQDICPNTKTSKEHSKFKKKLKKEQMSNFIQNHIKKKKTKQIQTRCNF